VLYRFQGPDGSNPTSRLLLDSTTGVLYGTTYIGGASNAGTVFALSPPAQGQSAWTESVLYSFSGGADGGFPWACLIADAAGALYSTTSSGGFTGNGTIFKLTPPSEGQTNWSETVLYSFLGVAATDGSSPQSGLVFDASGNLYGNTTAGGACCGEVFEASPPSGGGTVWTETTLYYFAGKNDGAFAAGDIIMDSNRNIYGTTAAGGTSNNGTVFKVKPPRSGEIYWTETRLTSFNNSDGSYPTSGLLPLKVGNRVVLFGNTFEGGKGDRGVVYEITGSGFVP
jgi:uncharacterized repeat protein (TIGR03803 family)